MKAFFNVARNIFAVIGLVLSIGLVIVLCSGEYKAIRSGARQESASHIETLKSSAPYGRDKTKFNIHPVIDPERAAEIRDYFQLDTLYDEAASTWEKTLAIARFVATNIPHANQTIQPEKRNAIYLWEYTKNTEPAFNCRLHSIMMFELLSSVGIKATYITCMPADSNDTDCHVVNQVWLPELEKWVMIDSDSGGFYATDDGGKLLSLQEMRESYIEGKPILYHPQFVETGGSDNWYYDYMAKNTYWFSCWETIHFDQEPAAGKDAGRYIHLVPKGFKPFGANNSDVVTSDAGQFWAAPGQPAALLLEDFDYFFQAFEQTHPDPYSAFGGERNFHKEVKKLRRSLGRVEGLDADRLQEEIGRFLVPLHDGHTYCGQMHYSNNSEVRFLPLYLRTMTDGFFVWSAGEDFKGLLGAEIKTIGGQPLDKLMGRLAEYVSSENVYGLYGAVSGWQMNSVALSLMLDDFDGEEVEMGFRTASGADTTAVLPLLSDVGMQAASFCSMPTDQRFPSSNFEYKWVDKEQGVMAIRCSHIVSRDCLQYILDHGMGEYEAVKNWAFPDTPFEEIPSIAGSFGSMLSEMKEAGAQHLIIDLRGNGGGWSPIVFPVLYQLYGDEYLTTDLGCRYETRLSELYLQKNNVTLEGYNEWQGSSYNIGDLMQGDYDMAPEYVDDSFRNAIIDSYMCLDKDMLRAQDGEPLYRPEHVYVVTNEGTFSAAFHFTYMLWKMGATVVGVPSSQAPNTFMESTPFTLPNTGIQCSVSNAIQRFFPADDPRAKVFRPDWTPTWEDYRRLGFDSRADLLYILEKISSIKKN